MSFRIKISSPTIDSLTQYKHMLGRAEQELVSCRSENSSSARDFSTLRELITLLSKNLPRLKIDGATRAALNASLTSLREGGQKIAMERSCRAPLTISSHALPSIGSLQNRVTCGAGITSPSTPSSPSLRTYTEDRRLHELRERSQREELLAIQKGEALTRELDALTERQNESLQKAQAEASRLTTALGKLQEASRSEIDSMRGTVERYLQHLIEIEKKIEDCSRTKSRVEERYAHLQKSGLSLAIRREVESLEQRKWSAEFELSKLAREVRDLTDRQEELEKRLPDQIAQVTQKIEALMESVAGREALLRANTPSTPIALTESGNFTSEQFSKNLELSSIQEQILSEQEQIQSLNHKKDALNHELAEIGRIEAQVAAARPRLEELRDALPALSAQLEAAKAEEARLIEEEEVAARDVIAIRKKLKQLQEEFKKREAHILPNLNASEKHLKLCETKYEKEIRALQDSHHDVQDFLENFPAQSREAFDALTLRREGAWKERERLDMQHEKELADLMALIVEERAKAEREAASSSTSSSSSSSRVPAKVAPMSGTGLADLPVEFTRRLDEIAAERNPATRSRLIRERLKAADIRKADLRELYITIGSPHTGTQDYYACEHYCYMHIGNYIEQLKAFIADKKRDATTVAIFEL